MNKGIAIKAGIILGFFAVVLGLAFGCSSIKNDDTTPQIQNGQDVFLTVGDIQITNQELWDKMKISDGLIYLNQYVEEMLLADYIALVTQEQIDEKVEQAIYGSNDPESIAKLQEDPELEEELILTYERTLILQGLDPDNADDVRSYFQLTIAKELYTRDFIEGITDEEDTLYLSEGDVKAHYASTVKGDVCAIVIRFHSYDEAEAVFDELNIVPNYEDRIGDYFGAEDIETVATANFDETNTTIMTDEEALDAFIALYNFQYGTSMTADLDDFCATYGDDFVYDYAELTDDFQSTSLQNTFADYLWDTLDLEDDDETDEDIPLRFSIQPRVYDDYQLMVYKLSEEAVTEYDDLTQVEKDALYEEVLDDMINATAVNRAMDELWPTDEYEIFDPLFKLQVEFSEGTEYDNNGDDVLVATLGTTDISAQDLFDYMVDAIGSYYALEMVKQESMLFSEYYENIYGDDHDYLSNTSEKMVEHRDELREMKSIFSSNGYAQYGFSSSDFTWEEFIILAFGSNSEATVLRDIFVMASVQPYLVRDMIAYENAADFIQEQIDDYFSLDATHLLLYLDNDFNFRPDEFNDFVDELAGADLTEYNALVVTFENLVKSKINNDDYTLDEIVDEYRNGLVNDPANEWADFKAYGFFIMTENLSPQNSLTHNSTGNFDEDFVLALKRIYDSYVVAVEADDDLNRYVDDRVNQSNFGLHFIIATEGDNFEQPSAEFDVTDTTYEAGFANDTMVPTQDQIELYIQVKFAELVDENADFTVPTAVRKALSSYYDSIFDAYFTASGYTIAAATYMIENDATFANDQVDQMAFLQTVIDVLFEVAFPDAFLTPAELS